MKSSRAERAGMRRRRLNLALEAHDRREQPLDLFVGEVEVRHPQLVERLQHAALVEDARIVQLGRGTTPSFDVCGMSVTNAKSSRVTSLLPSSDRSVPIGCAFSKPLMSWQLKQP